MPVGTQGAVKAITHRDLEDARRRDHPRQHLSPVPAARRRSDRAARRPAPVHRLAAADPHRQRRLPGVQPGRRGGRSTRTARTSGRTSTARAHLLTPEKAADIQAQLGSDIAMVLDECLAHPATDGRGRATSMERTLRWARRGARAVAGAARRAACAGVIVTNPGQAQFGIVQGGVYPDLRDESAEATVAIGFEAYAIGGLSVGEPADVMYDIVARTAPLLPDDRPRYLMGTGTPEDLVECVARGIDLFDCVLPTRNARNGQLFTSAGPHQHQERALRRGRRGRPIPTAACYTCRHLSARLSAAPFHGRRDDAATLNTLHNLYFYLDTMRRIREAIAFGRFESFRLAVPSDACPADHRFMTFSMLLPVFAMGASPGRRQPVAAVRAVCARPRHLLFHHSAADEAEAAEGAGVPRRAEGRRPRRHDRRHLRPGDAD